MNKKILAVLMVFAVMITCFAACKRHNYKTTNVNGQDLLLYTDKNGETVINDDNQIVAVVTDEAGEIITYENGEDQTRLVQIAGSYVGDDYIQDKEFKMAIPEGWEGTTGAKLYKKDTNNKCSISFMTTNKFGEDNTIESYLAEKDELDKQIKEGAEAKGQNYVAEKEPITVGTHSGWHYTYKMTDKDGKLTHYAENIYFTDEKTLCIINYACLDAVGYDEAFSFAGFIHEGFTYNG